MRSNRRLGIAGLLAALGSAAVIGSLAPLDASAQITNSRHNLTSSNSVGTSYFTPTSATAEICVFCHTPHGANTAVSAPLWNKAASTATYQMYSTGGSYSIDGTEAAVGSVSVACLSCHDGSLAINTMINVQGSGGWIDGTTASTLAGTWTNPNTDSGVDPATSKMRAGVIQNIGTDLRNDHPISIQFCGGGLSGSGTTVSGTCKDTDFKQTNVKTQVVNANQVFWVDTTGGTADVREKTDIALYTRSGGPTGPMVECASCHDPHTTANPTFLRVSNASSGLCLSCHTK